MPFCRDFLFVPQVWRSLATDPVGLHSLLGRRFARMIYVASEVAVTGRGKVFEGLADMSPTIFLNENVCILERDIITDSKGFRTTV